MSVFEAIFNLFAPYECLRCKTEGSPLCEVCAATLERVPSRCYRCKRREEESRTCRRCRAQSPLFSVWPVTMYDDAIAKELVRVLKFSRATGAAASMARLLVPAVSTSEGVCIVHVPTADARVRERGYDQAALIARELARLTGRRHLASLARTGSQRQTGQKRDARLQQMDGAFRVLHPDLLKNQHVLLVDDVLTTGATCEAAARALRQAGAKRVSAAVFAVA